MTQGPTDIGTVLPGGYRLSRLVAEDALGHHYAARDPSSHKQVAVLLVHPSLLEGDGAARFRAACEATAAFEHPNVVPLIAWGFVEGRGYRVTPWTGNRTLATALDGAILVSSAVGWGRELAEGLKAAHDAGLLHGGLSPGVVHLHRRQVPPDQARLDGFGLAQLLLAGDLAHSAGPGRPIGGAAWTSPEQALGRELTARSDLYALGALLFHALTGRPPFTGPSMKVLAAHVSEEPPAPSSVTTGIPHWLDEVVLGLLEKAPDDRPTAAAVVERLRDGAALLMDGAAHPEHITATVAPVRLPNAEIRGAASVRTPGAQAERRPGMGPSPLVGVLTAVGVFTVGVLTVVVGWWMIGGFP